MCAVATVVIRAKTALFQTAALNLTTVHLMAFVYPATEKRCADVSWGTVAPTAARRYALVEMDVRATANVLKWTCASVTTAIRGIIAVDSHVNATGSARVSSVYTQILVSMICRLKYFNSM